MESYSSWSDSVAKRDQFLLPVDPYNLYNLRFFTETASCMSGSMMVSLSLSASDR